MTFLHFLSRLAVFYSCGILLNIFYDFCLNKANTDLTLDLVQTKTEFKQYSKIQLYLLVLYSAFIWPYTIYLKLRNVFGGN